MIHETTNEEALKAQLIAAVEASPDYWKWLLHQWLWVAPYGCADASMEEWERRVFRVGLWG